ncbi:MAG TPA: Uma2 family endonuclease [Pirellulaceae bacterium]|jgi:Uma2 family endonuclease
MNVVLQETLRLPAGFANLGAFREWTKSESYPHRGQFAYLGCDFWIDLSTETFLHDQLKNEFVIVIGGLVKAGRLGRYLGDRMRLVNETADMSVEPDGMFASAKALKAGRVRLEEGADSLELIGSPQMVLEIISPTSVRKDTVVLSDLYFSAGIEEYWLVNPLGGQLAFDIFRPAAKEYAAVEASGGWLPSAVFGKSFRLVQETTDDGLPDFQLQVR